MNEKMFNDFSHWKVKRISYVIKAYLIHDLYAVKALSYESEKLSVHESSF